MPKRKQDDDEPEGVPWEKIPEDQDVPLPGPDVHLGRLRFEKSGSKDVRGRMEMPDLSTTTNSEKQEIAARMAKFRVRRAEAKEKTGTKLDKDTFSMPSTRSQAASQLLRRGAR